MADWLTAVEAAQRLQVSRQTLYAYVSRGLLQSHAGTEIGAGTRARRYRRSEVERLARQRSHARRPQQAARATLDFGLPVLSSSLCLIERGRLFYRGQDALQLAEHADLEDIAALLWPCDRQTLRAAPPAPASVVAPSRNLARTAQPRRALAVYHALCAQGEEHSSDTTEQAFTLVQRVLQALLWPVPISARLQREPIHRQLQQVWKLPASAAELLRATLVLCADHELNASSFATRCVASTGASLAASVGAGLAALTGTRHGGMTARVEAWLDDPGAALPRTTSPDAPVIPGFGHGLYPDGDPRARAILALLPGDRTLDARRRAVQRRTGLEPALDFALVALRRQLGLPPGSAFTLFAVARTVGWIAHALEQRREGSLIRPRAAYVGIAPEGDRPVAPPLGRVIRRR